MPRARIKSNGVSDRWRIRHASTKKGDSLSRRHRGQAKVLAKDPANSHIGRESGLRPPGASPGGRRVMSRERPRWPRSVRLIARGHAGMSGARSEGNALAGVRAWGPTARLRKLVVRYGWPLHRAPILFCLVRANLRGLGSCRGDLPELQRREQGRGELLLVVWFCIRAAMPEWPSSRGRSAFL